MNAKELRECAAIANQLKAKQQKEKYLIDYQECRAAMELEATEGKSALYWQRYLPQEHIDSLKKDGFQIEDRTTSNGYKYTISWFEN